MLFIQSWIIGLIVDRMWRWIGLSGLADRHAGTTHGYANTGVTH